MDNKILQLQVSLRSKIAKHLMAKTVQLERGKLKRFHSIQGVHKVRMHFNRFITLFVFAMEIIYKKCYKVLSS